MSDSAINATDCTETKGLDGVKLNDLPDDLIIFLFSYLTIEERHCVKLVCKRWWEIGNSACFKRKEICIVNNCSRLWKLKTVSPMNLRISPNRSLNRSLKKIRELRTSEFWRWCGSDLISLEICDFGAIWPEYMRDLLAYCCNLQHLIISGTYLAQFTSNTEENRRTCLALISLFKDGHPNSYWRLAEDIDERISSRLGSTLYPFFNSKVESTCYSVIAELLPNLTEIDLDLENIPELKFRAPTNEIEKVLHINQLTKVSLKKLTALTDTTIDAFHHLSYLTHLDLSGGTSLNDNMLLKLFSGTFANHLTNLVLSEIIKMSDAVILAAAPKLRNLRYLDLSCCFSLTNESLQVIFKHNVLLQYLIVNGCTMTIDLNVSPSINNLKNLERLEMKDCSLLGNCFKVIELPFLDSIDACGVMVLKEDIDAVKSQCPRLRQCITGHNWRAANFDSTRDRLLYIHRFGSAVDDDDDDDDDDSADEIGIYSDGSEDYSDVDSDSNDSDSAPF